MAEIITRDGRKVGLLFSDKTEKEFLALAELIASLTPTIYDDLAVKALRLVRNALTNLKNDLEFKPYIDAFESLTEAYNKRQEEKG